MGSSVWDHSRAHTVGGGVKGKRRLPVGQTGRAAAVHGKIGIVVCASIWYEIKPVWWWCIRPSGSRPHLDRIFAGSPASEKAMTSKCMTQKPRLPGSAQAPFEAPE